MAAPPVPQSADYSAQTPFFKAVRELVRAYQSFTSYSEAFVRQYDLTPAQFDVIATLGNTEGMSMGEIGEKTLITKGTLTGVVDRLKKKDLITREVPPENRRCVRVKLTPKGQALFAEVFPAHLKDMEEHFEGFDPCELERLQAMLQRLRQAF